jgi:glycosyltransferase involved in cell wall biosynthesis
MFEKLKFIFRNKDKNLLSCAISRYSGGKNQYTQLMKNALTAIDIKPRPISLRIRANFVWLHWFESKAGKKSALRFLEKCNNKGVRIIWNVHNKIPHKTTDQNRAKSFMKHLAEVSSKIVIHSKITTPLIEDLCKNDESVLKKIVYVPHPNYIGVYGTQKNDYCLDNNKLKLCFFGAVKKYKNVELLISAVTELGFEDVELNIYGRCRPRNYAQSLRALAGENNNIKMYFKFIQDKDVPEILAACHLLVLPYNLDSSLNSGATILAFSYGRTVLSPATGTLSDIEDKSLFFAYSYNNQDERKEELKKQIITIHEKYKGNYNELLKLGEKCRAYVAENSSLEQVAKQLEEVFDIKS